MPGRAPGNGPGPGPGHEGYPPGPRERQQLLFTPERRLGWVFRDRTELAVPYPEPEPDPRSVQARAAGRSQAAQQSLARAWKWAGKPSIGAALILIAMAGCARAVSGSYDVKATALSIGVLCLPGLAYTGWCWWRREQARGAGTEQEYRAELAAWDERAAGHEAAEAARLAGQPEWGSLTAPARRVDVFGGSLTGWQGLLTVHGASLLSQRPVLVADLSGQYASRMLVSAARATGITAVAYRLPQDLGRSGLLTELPPAQLANAIAEAIHPGGPGTASTRTDRAVDVRVLQQLAGVLARRGVTPRRLAAAVRTALGGVGMGVASLVPGGTLAPEEEELIAGDLFPAGYREQVIASLVRLDAVLSELAAYAEGGWPGKPARLTVLAMDPAARSASGEVLTSLLVQWLTVQVSAEPAAGTSPLPAVLIAGADEVTRAHAERLADACEVRGVPLTLMFRHLREDAASLLGGGTAAFMRLGNHAEAEQAASYIGRRHTFVVSSFTATRGGSLTTTRGTSDSCSTGDNESTSRNRGWSDNPNGGLFSGNAHSGGRARTTGTSTSRTTGTNWSAADGTNWSDAEGQQRVYEFAVEPTVLQNLPDYAMLLADRTGRELRLRTVECDPDIIALPGATTGPLPPPGAALPPADAYRYAGQGSPGDVGQGAPGDGWHDAVPPGGPAALDQPVPPALAGQYAGAQYTGEQYAGEQYERDERPWWQRNQPPEEQH